VKSRRKVRVAIADDDKPTLRVLSKLLKKQEGLEFVGAASTGVEAIVLADDLKPDVLLLDQQMPLATGSSVVREIRTRGLPVKIILISGHDLRATWQSMGADAFFAKGDEITDLLGLIDQWSN
jgi:DNA-binding NarL/FixJ family response regulator